MADASSTVDSATSVVSELNYRYLQTQIYENSGIVLDDSKHYLLESRLTPIVRSEGLKDLNALCNALRQAGSTPLRTKIVEAMTTNETLFFRDIHPFEALRSEILPAIKRTRSEKRLRIWSAASSTGQEAYSTAITLAESGFLDWNIDIVGTDLSEDVVQKARQGVFTQLEVNRGLPAQKLVRYFEREGIAWRLRKEIREMVRFQQFDLRNAYTILGRFDIVFCRNVLIYFDLETKRSILGKIRGVMAPDGYLFLGAAETTLNIDDRFARKVIGQAVCYQRTEDR